MYALRNITLFATVLIAFLNKASAAVVSNEIYSVDFAADEETVLSLTVNPNTQQVELGEYSNSNGNQRFIARMNSGFYSLQEDHTFTLFPEVQPWNWVDHIVESTKFVHIRQAPQALGVVGGSMEVIAEDYAGSANSRQKWYVVPTGSDENTGVITNLLQRQCLVGHGENQPLTLAPCNFSDTNQIFTIALRTTGRCF